MASFSEWISSSQKLKTLKVENFRDATLVGWQSFAAALASLDNLEDINVKFFEEDSRVGMILLNSFMAKPTLKRVEFPLPTVDQLQMIKNVLVSPNFIITDLPDQLITKQHIITVNDIEIWRKNTISCSLESSV